MDHDMERKGKSLHGNGCIKQIIDLLKKCFQAPLLCQALCVLGIGCAEMNKIGTILVTTELRVEQVPLLS